MRTRIIVLVTLVLSTEALAQSTVAFPHDPYRWCAVYSGDAGGASNCGFLTISSIPATVLTALRIAVSRGYHVHQFATAALLSR
ncbi:MAG: hypothetical protein WAL49_17105, partial [Pseudolabrys sp.]